MGWIGNIFIVLGLIFIAYQKRSGFILSIIGNGLWCIKGFITGQSDLIVIQIIVCMIAAFSWWNWRRINVRTIDPIYSGPTSE